MFHQNQPKKKMYLYVEICFFILIVSYQATLSQNKESSLESNYIVDIYDDIMDNVEVEWNKRMYMIKYGNYTDELQYLYHMILVSSMVMNSYHPLKNDDLTKYMFLLWKFKLVDKRYIQRFIKNFNRTALDTFYQIHQFRTKIQTIPTKWSYVINDIFIIRERKCGSIHKCKYEVLIHEFNEQCKMCIDENFVYNIHVNRNDSKFYEYKRRQMLMRIVLLITVWSEFDVLIENHQAKNECM